MPVFHTKTIESILEPVAFQVSDEFIVLSQFTIEKKKSERKFEIEQWNANAHK